MCHNLFQDSESTSLIIGINCDTTLMKYVEKTFPTPYALLGWYHLTKNVRSNIKILGNNANQGWKWENDNTYTNIETYNGSMECYNQVFNRGFIYWFCHAVQRCVPKI